MHRAEQIIERIAALHHASAEIHEKVFVHRVLSLAEDQDELPAFSVTYGEDQPQTEQFDLIDSLLTVRMFAFSVNPNEQALRSALMAMRAKSHRILQADYLLGLAFVSDTRYGGALAPEIIHRNQFVGALECRWQVLYRMNRTDPE